MHSLRNSLMLSLVVVATHGCRPSPSSKSFQDRAAESITEDFVERYVRPLSDPVANAAHASPDIPNELLLASRVTAVEIHPRRKAPEGGNRPSTVYENESIRPPSDGMITGVPNARLIGLFYPKTSDQEEVEVRMNYDCDLCGFIAVHVIVPNPLRVAQPGAEQSTAGKIRKSSRWK